MDGKSIVEGFGFSRTFLVLLAVVAILVQPLSCHHGRQQRHHQHLGHRQHHYRRYGTPVWTMPCVARASSVHEESEVSSGQSDERLVSMATSGGELSLMADLVRPLVNNAMWTRYYIAEMMARIEGRIMDSNVIAYYTNLPPLPGFPPLLRSPSINNLTIILPADYERVSKMAVFLEQAKHDTRAYSRELTLVFSHLSSVLCWLEQSSLALCQQLGYSVTRDIMAAEFRRLPNSALKDIRNYLIGRDCLILLNDMIGYYETQLVKMGNTLANCY